MNYNVQLCQKIFSTVFSNNVIINSVKPQGGGSINQAVIVDTSKGIFFLKWNKRSDMFQKEAAGLKLLASVKAIAVPDVIATGGFETVSFLLLEYVGGATKSGKYWTLFGLQLAELHKCNSDFYGLNESNYIGSLLQDNHLSENWNDFFVQNRLEVQIKLAFEAGLLEKKHLEFFKKLYGKLPEILVSGAPSLVHGDLWNGNLITNNIGNPALIDPAVYYGNREVDLAMTTLFGGFHDEFYRSYQEAFPMEQGYKDRWEIYNLYPLLVHLNLFGKGYLSSITSILKKYVS